VACPESAFLGAPRLAKGLCLERSGCQAGRVDQRRAGGDDRLSIQQSLYPDLPCFGCGPANAKGLQLRSYPFEGSVIATFAPWPEHDNGLGFLNGGIISTVLDCHSAAAVLWEADGHGWASVSGAALPYVTAGLNVRFLRPSPLTGEVELTAHVTEATEAEMRCEVELSWEGKTRAAATAVWKRWRPR
jgi:acyl-coenzyme A thioesterase PaaI-like protein